MFGHFTSGDINRKCNIVSYMKPNFYNKKVFKIKMRSLSSMCSSGT